MKKRYKAVKIPIEAWENFNEKREKMEKTIKEITKKQNFNIKLTNFMRFISQKPTDYIYPNELIDYFLNKKTKKKEGFYI